ncbi:MAG: hypothetical protein ACRENE_25815 [Polyangiaceae bacterium]
MSLQWSDERYVRLYTRDTPGWLLGPWEARAVLPLVLRKLDRAGTIPLGQDGLEALAIVVALPLDVVTNGMVWLLQRGTFELVDGVLVAPNFIAAQEAKASDKKRAAEHRERTRDQARAGTLASRSVTDRHEDPETAPEISAARPDGGQRSSDSVTIRDESITQRDGPSRKVANRHADSAGVTPSCAVPSRTVPSEKPPLTLAVVEGEPRKRGRKEAKAPIPGHGEVIAAFVEEYERARGCKPEIGAKERTAANRLLLQGKRPATEAVAIVRRAMTDPFVRERKPDLAYIAGNVNAFQGTAPPKASGVHPAIARADEEAARNPSRQLLRPPPIPERRGHHG